MRLVVEVIGGNAVQGWARDDEAPASAVGIHVDLAGQRVAATQTGLYRPDLSGEGREAALYGFHAELPADAYLRLLEAPATLAVRGVACDGRVVDAEFYRTGRPQDLNIVFPRDGGGVRLMGDSYVKDNVVAFGDPIDRPIDCTLPGGATPDVPVLSIKLEIFGDASWWAQGADGSRVPTADIALRTLGDDACARIHDGELLLLLDMSNEAPSVDRDAAWLTMLLSALDARGVLGPGCVFVSQNAAFGDDLRAWAGENGLRACDAAQHDYYLRRFAGLRARAIDDAGRAAAVAAFRATLRTERERAFVCLNFTPRRDRLAFLSWLAGHDLLDQGFVSFKGFRNHKLDGSGVSIPDWFPDRARAEAGLRVLTALGALAIDVPRDSGAYTPEFDPGPEHIYRDSAFSIVTESEFSGGDILRITEKTLKPAAMLQPFVVVGNPGSLARFRELGFQSFAPFIDERYDLEVNPTRRMRLVQAEIARLVALGAHGRAELLAQLEDRIVHNYVHIHGPLDARYRYVIEPALVARLHAVGRRHLRR